MPEAVSEVLVMDKLCSGDRPSIFIAGMLVAHALKKGNLAVITTDILGRVIVLPPAAVKLSGPVLLSDKDLDGFEEDVAIGIMTTEGRNEDDILSYIKRRHSREETTVTD